MEFSLRGWLQSLTQKEVDDLNKTLDNFDPVEYEKREALRDRILGFDHAVTEYTGRGSTLTGVTKWVDTRNNKEYELKTYIEVDVYGTKKFKDYIHITTLNGREFKRARQKSATIKVMKDTHDLYKGLFFSRAKSAFVDNHDTDFEPAFG
ncbi:MAG: hypothetical protein EOO15_18005 [Chitinophagaceae bacterium]|nr:MAG: hypothetical protein EOO15_18005 [Chitinophagaceae bacterium]